MADDTTRSGTGGYSSLAIRDYIESLYSPPANDLTDAVGELERTDMPRIQISPTDGSILRLLLQMIRAKRVVEFGTLSGYSGLWMLRALGVDGHLWTCEYSSRHAEVARGVFERAGYGSQVTILEGDGRESLKKLEAHAPFDAVFIDADKSGYPLYARWAFDHLRPGGLIVADNTYLFGYLAGRAPDRNLDQRSIEAMQEFHVFLTSHCVAACLPTPDGLSVGIKPGNGF
ncbi:O-methyltransferase [Gloeobacter kilaueensis]|uniref:O-methyltransferase n=1 Tax=Gloeobacter kilaueensis (strain ATCC BAA-2537 / CCAP 1431/1 / ULC 316 / JS1) TaxID=1183438 RepID=U5QPJ7_GLOK1|nr:O-methyltransferase [Gloeobacter kilaueensis]AGY59615.1 O-methyltransferase [Gloeobacter kilaueensis JS1]